MALRKIVEQGDECLTKICRPVEKFDRRLHDLLDDMAETLAAVRAANPAARVVISAIAIESLSAALAALSCLGWLLTRKKAA